MFNPFTPVVAIWQSKSAFFKITITIYYPNQVSFTFKLFLNMFPIYWSNSRKKRLVSAEETSK